MSALKVERLECRECEERLVFAPDFCLYRSPDETTGEPSYRRWNWCPVLTDRVWCRDCDGARYAERLPSMDEFMRASAVRRMPDWPRPPNLEDELLEVGDAHFEFLLAHVAGRRGPGRCLACSGSDVHGLQVAVDRVVNFTHPICDGWLHLETFYPNGVGRKTIRWFSTNGEHLGDQEDCF